MTVYMTMNDMTSDYVTLVDYVRTKGRRVVVRDLETREVSPATLNFPRAAPDVVRQMLPVGVGRGVNSTLAHVEALSLFAGTWPQELIAAIAPGYAAVLVDPRRQHQVAYGVRIADQLDRMVNVLLDDPSTRQAVLRIWRSDDLDRVGDRPCTLTIQFMIRDGALNMHVSMRSQDVWLGAAMDMFLFSQLQHTLAYVLDVPVGDYWHTATSMHFYRRDGEAAMRLHAPTPIAGSPASGLRSGDPVSEQKSAIARLHGIQDAATALLTRPTDEASFAIAAAANPIYATHVAAARRLLEVHA